MLIPQYIYFGPYQIYISLIFLLVGVFVSLFVLWLEGTKDGFDLKLTEAVSKAVNIPVIASGGAGKLEHFYDVFTKTGADAALAASIFHYNEIPIADVKKYLKERSIAVRV